MSSLSRGAPAAGHSSPGRPNGRTGAITLRERAFSAHAHGCLRRDSRPLGVQFDGGPGDIHLHQLECQAFAADRAEHLAGRLLHAVAEGLVIRLDFQARLCGCTSPSPPIAGACDLVAVILRAFEGWPWDRRSGSARHRSRLRAKRSVETAPWLSRRFRDGGRSAPDLPAAGADPVPAGRQGLFKPAVAVEQHGLELLDADPVEADQRHDAFRTASKSRPRRRRSRR